MLMLPPFPQLDKLLGMAMLIVASTVFLYYTIWTLFMVGSRFSRSSLSTDRCSRLWTTDTLFTAFSRLESGPFVFRSYSPYLALP
jgi:Dolichol phosphate-mannose biosynthesis regulatory protein (DPM2)